jgi:hypothetical protein
MTVAHCNCSERAPTNKGVGVTLGFGDCRTNDGLPGSNSTCLVSSIKVEVKKKHFCAGWNFSCFSAHWMEQDLF